MIIQIFGTPCTGKTTYIKQFIKTHNSYIWYDVAQHRDINDDCYMAENKILKKILSEKKLKNYILESATGIHDIDSFNVKFSCNNSLLETNHKKRKLPFDNSQIEYYSLLQTIEIVPDLIISITEKTTYLEIDNKIRLGLQKYYGLQ